MIKGIGKEGMSFIFAPFLMRDQIFPFLHVHKNNLNAHFALFYESGNTFLRDPLIKLSCNTHKNINFCCLYYYLQLLLFCF